MNHSRWTAFVLVLTATTLNAAEQETSRVLKANSAVVDIVDGHHLRKGHWTAAPDVAIDTYYVQRFTGSKQVTFRSDVDSITFTVKPGDQIDFVILLNGKDRCKTRVSTLRRTATQVGADAGKKPAEIPFRIGPDHKIHIEGKINDSPPLDFMFDTGADNLVLYQAGLDKQVNLQFDGDIDNSGLGGTSKRKTSNDNRLAIANLQWDHEMVMFIEKQADQANGIVGYNIFEDKIVEIDYDNSVIRVHDTLPVVERFAKCELRFPGTIPLVETTLNLGEATISDWLVIDTGYSGSVYLNHGFTAKYGAVSTMHKLGTNSSAGVGKLTVKGEYLQLPSLTLGGATLNDLPISAELPTAAEQTPGGLLGMDVLKRFHTILDYQSNTVYFKPNSLFGTPFRQPPIRMQPILFGIMLSTIAIILLAIARRKRRVVASNS